MTNDYTLLSSADNSRIASTKVPDFNLDDFRADVEALGIDPEQASEFLAVLWDIMGRMADLGLRVDVCGQFFDRIEEDFARAAKGIESDEPNDNGDA